MSGRFLSLQLALLSFLIVAGCNFSHGDVVCQPGSAMIAFAAAELRTALAGSPAQVTLGTVAWLPRDPAPPDPPTAAESFATSRTATGRILIAGRDEAGALYGGLETAEQIRLGGLAGVTPTRSEPFLAFRQYKYNLPNLDPGADDFHTEAYWRSLFDSLARARYNSISLWHQHPFPYMLRFAEFPEAALLTPAQTQRNLDTFRMIFRLARDRNLSSYLISWNVHLSSAFAKAHGIANTKVDTPEVRDYVRYCVAETLRTYPDLTGLGTCAGESMPDTRYDWIEEWIRDTYIAGIHDSGRLVPFIHRYWYADASAVQRLIATDYPGRIIVEVKYNGEHLYSGRRPHFLDPDWIDYPDYQRWLRGGDERGPPPPEVPSHLSWVQQQPRSYDLIWHLRNDCITTLRWGDPGFVSTVLRNAGQDFSTGYLMGQERTQTGVDRSHTEAARDLQTWTYEHERIWFQLLLWGRLGYDPGVPETRWQALFQERYGAPGEDLYAACISASQIIPAVTRFHFNYMNGDWAPEWCWGEWNTGFGRGFNYRDTRGFHNLFEFIFNHTIEDAILDIPEYVGMQIRGEPIPAGTATPLSIAADLQRASATALAARARLRTRGEPQGEVASCCADFAASAELGAYYAAKIRGATALMRFLASGQVGAQAEAAGLFDEAGLHWRAFCASVVPLYRRAGSGSASVERSWGAVQRDALLARQAVAAPEQIATCGVLKRAAERRHFDFRTLGELIESRIAPTVIPVRQLEFIQIGPEVCDAVILGREAAAFNALSPSLKRRLGKAVTEGLPLVLFFQNFPSFEVSWLPPGISGTNNDSDTFVWVGTHPVTDGVDPAALASKALVNDRLVAAGKEWLNLTDPAGGICLWERGKARIAFCQLEILGQPDNPAAQRLVRNLVRWATAGKESPRLLYLDGPRSTVSKILKPLKYNVLWPDEMPLSAVR